MYLHIGASTVLRRRDIVAILDLDNSSASYITRAFLQRAEREHRLEVVGEDIPKSLLLCQEEDGPLRVYLTQLSPAALSRRFLSNTFDPV